MTIQVQWERGHDEFPRLYWRLDKRAHHAFQQYGSVRELAAGDMLFHEGDSSFCLYIVLEGDIAILVKGAEVARVTANHSLGEMGMLLDTPRTAAAQAIGAVRVLEISREGLLRMQDEAPIWSTRLYRVLAECLAEYLHRSVKE